MYNLTRSGEHVIMNSYLYIMLVLVIRVMWNTEMVTPEWHKSFSEYLSFSFLQKHFIQLE